MNELIDEMKRAARVTGSPNRTDACGAAIRNE